MDSVADCLTRDCWRLWLYRFWSPSIPRTRVILADGPDVVMERAWVAVPCPIIDEMQ